MRKLIKKFQLALITGGLLMTGTAVAAETVDRYPSIKQRASEATRDVKENLKESLLNAKVRLALLKGMTGADGLRVNVKVINSAVYLSGEVGDRASEKLASEMALAVEGVSSVKSTIRLNINAPQQDDYEATVKDAILSSEVKMTLLQEVGDNAMDINVEAASGVVSLRGTVPNTASRNRAVNRVKDLPGVVRVEDLLKTPKR